MSSTTTRGEAWAPHPYQERAIKIMIQQSAAGLLLDPGLGKTSCSLAAFKLLKKQGFADWALVIAPLKPMYETWPAEIKKWSNFRELTHVILHGVEKNRRVKQKADLYLINPAGLNWLFESKNIGELMKRGNGILIVDESTQFKDSSTQRFKLLKMHLPKFKRRYILTGTFTPNGLSDMFGQMYVLDGGNSLGKYITHFKSRYFYQPNPSYERYRWEPQEGAFDEVVRKISPLVLQLNAEDHLKMPKLITVPDERAIRWVELPDEAWSKYKAMEDDFISDLGDSFVVASNAAVAGGKCRQIANGALYINQEHDYSVIHDEKIEALASLIDELQGQPLLILYEFVHDKDRMLKKWPKMPFIGGGVSQKKVSSYLTDFNAGRLPYLAGHPQSMGHGLNMQGSCRHVCWFGIPWNFEHYDQAIRRVYRQGQKSDTVFIYHIVAKDTLDEKVLGVLGHKKKNMKDLYSALKPSV